MNNNIPSPTTATLEAYDALPVRIQLALDTPQVMKTCPQHAPRSYIEHWAITADTESPAEANRWLLEQFGVTQ